jgi:hypothetical protein
LTLSGPAENQYAINSLARLGPVSEVVAVSMAEIADMIRPGGISSTKVGSRRATSRAALAVSIEISVAQEVCVTARKAP